MTVPIPLGWGLDPYGLSVLGSTLHGADLYLVSALAVSTNDVQVTLSKEPRHASSSGAGDALNPATWTVQRLDTAEYFDIAEVVEEGNTIFTLHVLQGFGDVSVEHVVTTSSLVDESGSALGTPRHANFLGIAPAQSEEAALLATLNVTPRDVANPQAPKAETGLTGGTLQIDSSGDYVPVSGTEFVRKMIYRRIGTRRGEFFHLPDYGLDLPVKEVVRAGELPLIKAEIERQIRREPEVIDIRAAVSLSGAGVLTARIKARLKTGETLEGSTNLPTLVAL